MFRESMQIGYDIVGDIHGCHQTLEVLLATLGYTIGPEGYYRQFGRTVIYLGDFIDRGPGQREVLDIVRPMIDSGAALAVMGNHEFNAIAYATRDPVSGQFLRQHSPKNAHQHKKFLDAFDNSDPEYRDAIEWFKTLPLWLDLGALRVVHACWDQNFINRVVGNYESGNKLSERLLFDACQKGSWQFEAVETLLKGKEVPLREGSEFQDTDGNHRHAIRVRWWDRSANTLFKAFMGPESARTHIPDDEITGDHLIDYSHSFPPVFIGHYWLEGIPQPLAPNIACVDYSVGKKGGKLAAYRWNGEVELLDRNFVSIERVGAV